uniref:hypothetical protein n=1 Tax=Armatimonas sp. TaxID=1872638 RepID=UPI00286C6BE3
AVGSAAAILHPNSEPSPTMGAPMALPMIQSTPAPRRDPFETVGKIARPEPRMGNVIMGARAVPTREVMGEMPVPEMGDVAASNPKTLSSNH